MDCKVHSCCGKRRYRCLFLLTCACLSASWNPSVNGLVSAPNAPQWFASYAQVEEALANLLARRTTAGSLGSISVASPSAFGPGPQQYHPHHPHHQQHQHQHEGGHSTIPAQTASGHRNARSSQLFSEGGAGEEGASRSPGPGLHIDVSHVTALLQQVILLQQELAATQQALAEAQSSAQEAEERQEEEAAHLQELAAVRVRSLDQEARTRAEEVGPWGWVTLHSSLLQPQPPQPPLCAHE